MDLPCFLLSWLRNLQLIPLTQSQAEDDDDWEEGDDIFLYRLSRTFWPYQSHPTNLAPKNLQLEPKRKMKFWKSLLCFAATHRWLESLKNVAYLEIIFTNYPSSVVCMKNEMKNSLKLYFSSIFSPL